MARSMLMPLVWCVIEYRMKDGSAPAGTSQPVDVLFELWFYLTVGQPSRESGD